MVDLQTNIKAQQSAAYAGKVTLSNLKEMARTVIYVQEHGYDTWDDLQMHSRIIFEKLLSSETGLQEAQKKLQKTNEQIHYTSQYYATRAVWAEFLKAGNKKQFGTLRTTPAVPYSSPVSHQEAGFSVVKVR